MATSGSKDYTVTRLQIIQAALRKCGAYDSQETLSAAEQEDAAFALNLLLKEWSKRRIDIMVRDDVTLFLDKSTSKYTIGGTESPTTEIGQNLGRNGEAAAIGTIYESATEVALTARGSSMDCTITTDWPGGSTVGFGHPLADGDRVVLELDSGRTHYGKVGNVSAPTITTDDVNGTISYAYSNITIGQVRSPVAIGNKMYFYRNKASRPVSILYASRVSDSNEVPVSIIGETDYQTLNTKTQQGPTTQLWHRAGTKSGLTQQSGGVTLEEGIVSELFVWPLSGIADTYNRLKLVCQFRCDDMDNSADEMQFPIEWANAIIFNLAHDLAPEYGVSREERIDLYTIGQGKLKELLDHDVEDANVVITLDQSAYGGR